MHGPFVSQDIIVSHIDEGRVRLSLDLAKNISNNIKVNMDNNFMTFFFTKKRSHMRVKNNYFYLSIQPNITGNIRYLSKWSTHKIIDVLPLQIIQKTKWYSLTHVRQSIWWTPGSQVRVASSARSRQVAEGCLCPASALRSCTGAGLPETLSAASVPRIVVEWPRICRLKVRMVEAGMLRKSS